MSLHHNLKAISPLPFVLVQRQNYPYRTKKTSMNTKNHSSLTLLLEARLMASFFESSACFVSLNRNPRVETKIIMCNILFVEAANFDYKKRNLVKE